MEAAPMQVAQVEHYGSLVVRDVEQPQPAEGELLVRVHAISLNAVDWYAFSGRPYAARLVMGLWKPKSPELGGDFAGVVETAREGSPFAPGDEVYGHERGAFAEYVAAGSGVERKPANLSVEEAAAVPLAGLTALQGLRDHGAVHAGQTVLVNGAAGGVGTFAVQIAKVLGAEVHAVCSERNVEQTRELGADRVFNYNDDDFTRSGARYDVLFDNAGNRSWSSMRRCLAPEGKVVLVGGPRRKRLLGPLGHIARVKLASRLGGRSAIFFITKPNQDDLATLRDLIEAGHVKPVIARRYEFADIAGAMQELSGDHARAKIVLTVRPSPPVGPPTVRHPPL
jgi:NADPH:quinone reductase-like Zn-dependent oxidoreductase